MQNLFREVLTIACGRSKLMKLSCKLHTKGSKEKRRNKLVSYALNYYVKLVKSWEEKFPTAAKFYKTFSAGIKEFKDDSLLLFNIYKKLSFDGIYCLTRKELEVYHEMPKNIIKVSPMVVAAALPFGTPVFALGCMFPKQILSPHFWSETQKNEFALIDHKKRLQLHAPIISCLESRLKSIKCHTLEHQITIILEGLRSGITPTAEEIIRCKQLFQESPFSLRSLGTSHTSLLLNLHKLHRGWRRKSRLEQFAALMRAMDAAVVVEGGFHLLTASEIHWASFFRGLNPNNMSKESIELWLNNWLRISKEVDETCYSLLLHCPVFLGYNEPTNVALIKDYRN